MFGKTRGSVSRRNMLKASGSIAAVSLIEALPSRSAAAGKPPSRAGSELAIDIEVNGQSHHIAVDARMTLLDALREKLALTGTKKGCDHGQCGACTVLMNGRRVLSCLTLAAAAEGSAVVTIEGLAADGELHP